MPLALGMGKGVALACYPQWATFSGFVLSDPHSSLYNKYHPHFINKASEGFALRREGSLCPGDAVWH